MQGRFAHFSHHFIVKMHNVNLRAAVGADRPPGSSFPSLPGVYFMPRLTISVTTKLATSSP
jgi:hypothetical protein